MTTATAPVETETLDLTVPDAGALPPALAKATEPAFTPTGNPIMDMAQRASIAGDVGMLKELLAIRDAEDRRGAVAAFNAAFAAMQAEMPIVPKRGRGHNDIQYARIEDIYQVAMPVLAKHGLSLRHRIDAGERGQITVTAVLAHVQGHSEEAQFVAGADGSGKKNSLQAKGSTITYGKRYTAEAVLGLTSHGEDDDAFAAGDTPKVAEWRERIGEAEPTKKAYLAIRAELMRDVDMSGVERAECERILRALFAALPEAERNG